jgi:hypothetical protein
MSKVKIPFLLCTVILLAAVAVFLNLGHSGFFQGSNLNGASPSATPIETLSADGTDPQPPPLPLPWYGVTS